MTIFLTLKISANKLEFKLQNELHQKLVTQRYLENPQYLAAMQYISQCQCDRKEKEGKQEAISS